MSEDPTFDDAETLEDALKDVNTEAYSEDGLKLVELGIHPETVAMLETGWKKRVSNEEYKGTKSIFYPNAESFENLTKGFWNWALDTIYTMELLDLDLTKLPEELRKMGEKAIESRRGKDYKIQELQQNLSQKLGYTLRLEGLVKEMFTIFQEEEVEGELSESGLNTLKEVIE